MLRFGRALLLRKMPFWAVFCLVLASCGSHPPYPRGELEKLFPTGHRPVLEDVLLGERSLRVARLDAEPTPQSAAAPIVLFIHGSPGDWEAWASFLATESLDGLGARLAVDRPGFGGSTDAGLMLDLRQQAALLARLIPPGKRAIVVGHSLGGPIAAWMAIDRPDLVCGAVSVAGSLAPTLEAPRWYNRAAQLKLVQWVLPREMLASNREMMGLSSELTALGQGWKSLRVPFVLMQGMNDTLVDPRTPDRVAPLAPSKWLQVRRYPGEGHFVLWEKPELVIDAIRSLPCAAQALS